MTAVAIQMHHTTARPPARRSHGAMGRLWPRSPGATSSRREGWSETLRRFWPRGRVAPVATAQVVVRRPIAARKARAVPRRDRPSAPRKLRPGARPKSLGLEPLNDIERRQLRADERLLRRAGAYARRPKVYGDCEEKPGPCPWVTCRMNLFLEVNEVTGAIKLNFPDKQIDELAETCALRVAGRRGHSLEEVGKLINLTQERVSQIEESGAAKFKRRIVDPVAMRAALARDEVGDGEPPG